jgi:SNF2 family DNA or RNA helicase
MYNWSRELSVWGDRMNTVVYMGNPDSREKMRDMEFYFNKANTSNNSNNNANNANNNNGGGAKKKRALKFNVLITSYDTAISDLNVFKKISWECLVVDEAHRLKNNDSKFFKTSQQISTKFKVLLTGTPLQNNIIEVIIQTNIFIIKIKIAD